MFLRLAFAHHEARPEQVRLRPVLDALARRFGEAAHYAVLDGREVVHRAKVDAPTGAVRLTSTIGGRDPEHTTAVELTATRERGYGVDDQENQTGVNCLALAVCPNSPTVPAGAVSVNAPAYRTPLGSLVDARDEIRAVLGPLAEPDS